MSISSFGKCIRCGEEHLLVDGICDDCNNYNFLDFLLLAWVMGDED